MTGYKEILTDPSYAGQIITFTFPHRQCRHQRRQHRDGELRGNARRARRHPALGDHRAVQLPRHAHLDQWLKSRGIIGLAGIDTRALTAFIREKGMPNAVIAHEPSGRFDRDALAREAERGPDLSAWIWCRW